MDETHALEGDPIGECAAALDRFSQVAALGVNCTPPQYVTPLLRQMHAATDKPLVAYPNSGEVYEASSGQWNGGSAALDFGEQARHWQRADQRLFEILAFRP